MCFKSNPHSPPPKKRNPSHIPEQAVIQSPKTQNIHTSSQCFVRASQAVVAPLYRLRLPEPSPPFPLLSLLLQSSHLHHPPRISRRQRVSRAGSRAVSRPGARTDRQPTAAGDGIRDRSWSRRQRCAGGGYSDGDGDLRRCGHGDWGGTAGA